MSAEHNPSGEGKPRLTFDLAKGNAERFAELVAEFDKWRRSLGELPQLKLKNGWYTINHQTAEEWLLRNFPGANRKLSLPTIVYYASQQVAGAWPRTGQPIIFDANGHLIDGQHRLWAAYLSGASFESYVVADVPPVENLFAYIDNSKVRTASTALATAGLNGLSSLIHQTIQIDVAYEAGAYTATSKKRMERMAPIQVIKYVETHPNIRQAARLAAGEYKQAAEVIGHKDVVSFVVYKVASLWDETVVDEFLDEVGEEGEEETSLTSAVVALHKVLQADRKARDQMSKHQILGYVIKAFNIWKLGGTVKKLSFKVNESYPRFITADEPQSVEADLELA